jgi:membrane-bound lytic murein transglycosylase B
MRIIFSFLAFVFFFTEPAKAQGISFAEFIQEIHHEALAAGISEQTLISAFKNIEENERVIALDRTQPSHKTVSFKRYIERTLPKNRIKLAKKKLHENRALLKKLEATYHVPGRFIIALWGIESNFGQNTGGFSVIESLATLAYEGRRAEFFRKELLLALRIIDEGHIAAEQMKGSWAGAMGMPQFMPSSFLELAVDGNNDGKIDIWNSKEDALASIANYLSTRGWNKKTGWGREVKLTQNLAADIFGKETKKSLSAWSALGLRQKNGKPLPKANITASLIRPAETSGPSFLIYPNYHILLDWNRSLYFATSVGIFADHLR